MSTPRRIVLIDDDPLVRDATQFALMDLGFVVDAAADWAAAEAQLEAPADLVVTDLQMPGLADAVIVERLRTRAPHTPIIALSAGATPSVARPWRSAPMHSLVKPATFPILARAITAALAGVRAEAA
ncbi:MAG: response regulator transcription factor [Caulobacteraceae bacterium]|nr:response regulator transcription factor [Caulobacteraceae bacterium]